MYNCKVFNAMSDKSRYVEYEFKFHHVQFILMIASRTYTKQSKNVSSQSIVIKSIDNKLHNK